MANYEFTSAQNETIGGLAHKMRGVGAFLVVIGILNLLTAAVLLGVIYQHELPPEVLQNVPPEAKAELEKLPPQNQLWAYVINAGAVGLIYLCIGGWTRSAAKSFAQITRTENRDIEHLMNGMASLHRMYGLIYGLLVIMMVFLLLVLGLAFYHQYMR